MICHCEKAKKHLIILNNCVVYRYDAEGGLTMTDLKPCPFCGGKALLSHDHAGIEASYVRCEKCGLESIRFLKSFECASDDRAVEFWNMRADNG